MTYLLAETGFYPIEMTIKKKRIMQAQRIMNKEDGKLIKKVVMSEGGIWMKETKVIMEEYQITEEDLQQSEGILAE